MRMWEREMARRLARRGEPEPPLAAYVLLLLSAVVLAKVLYGWGEPGLAVAAQTHDEQQMSKFLVVVSVFLIILCLRVIVPG